MYKITFTDRIARKLKDDAHQVDASEVKECFDNVIGNYLYDLRERHQTIPRTQWFVAETNAGRELKICFLDIVKSEEYRVKTAYDADDKAKEIYKNNS